MGSWEMGISNHESVGCVLGLQFCASIGPLLSLVSDLLLDLGDGSGVVYRKGNELENWQQ